MSTDQPLPCLIAGEPTLPVIATAIHAGHAVRPEIAERLALSEEERLREEDPFTDRWTAVAPLRVVGRISRFEVDLNRPRDGAVYRVPDDAWGLEVWRGELPQDVVDRSLERYDAFYEAMGRLLDEMKERFGSYVVLDLHSYNHRRDGAGAPPADPAGNPEVNLGTSNLDLDRFGPLLERLGATLHEATGLDVRTDVKFRGGQFSRWVNDRHAGDACSIPIEFKKTFMDEWTGLPDESAIARIRSGLDAAIQAIIAELGALTR